MAIFQVDWVSQYQNGFYCNKDDEGGGDNWSYKTCKAPVKSSPVTNQGKHNTSKTAPNIL